MAKFYGYFENIPSDVLNSGYPTGGLFEIKTQTKTGDGLSIGTSASTGKKGISATVTPKYYWKDRKIEFTTKLSSLYQYQFGINLQDLITYGSNVSFDAKHNENKGWAASAVTSYKKEFYAVKAGLEFPFEQEYPIKLNSSVGFKLPYNIHVAGSAKYQFPSENNSNSNISWDFATAYIHKKFQLCGFYKYKPALKDDNQKDQSSFGFNWLHDLSPLKVAFSSSFDPNFGRGPIFACGYSYKFDDYTTLKNRVNIKLNSDFSKKTEYRVGVGIHQKVSDSLSVSVGADLNLRHLCRLPAGTQQTHSFGFSMKINN